MIIKAQLCFSSGDSLLSKLIKLVQRATEAGGKAPLPMATHAYLIFIEQEGLTLVASGIEARPPRVRTWDVNLDFRASDRKYEIPLSPDLLQVLYENSKKHVDQGYHYWGDVLAGVYSLTRMTLPDPEKIEFFCSQLCTNLLRQSGIDILGKIPDRDITPASLEIWATKHLVRKV